MLDVNLFFVAKDKFARIEPQAFRDAFSFLGRGGAAGEDPGRDPTKQFLDFCMLGSGALSLQITYKLGIPSFINLSQQLPNFYKVTSARENACILEKLFREARVQQRVVLVFRPIVVRSAIDEPLLNVFRINEFVIRGYLL